MSRPGGWAAVMVSARSCTTSPGKAQVKSGLRLQIDCALFALPLINFHVIRDFLSLIQTPQPGAFHGADVNKYIASTSVRLNKPVTLVRVEPLHRSRRHVRPR